MQLLEQLYMLMVDSIYCHQHVMSCSKLISDLKKQAFMHAILSHPALIDCRRLFLRDYEIFINIGVHGFEKKAEQRVILHVDLYILLAMNTSTHDQLDEVVDYDFMRETIKDRASKVHIHLQETFCDDVVSAMLSHPKALAARVSTAKPDVCPDCHSVGVEVFRIKNS